MYRAGAKGYFDAVGSHVYPYNRADYCPADVSEKRGYLCGLHQMHDVMEANGDGHKKIWLTEFGRYSCTAEGRRQHRHKCTTVEEQARFVTESYRFLQSYSYVQAAIWFSDYDYGVDELYGLRDFDLNPRPGYAKFQAVADKYRRQFR
jgi:hypothetical protein